MNAHTCSTLVGTPAFAQPPRALAPAFGQVRRAPSPSAVPSRAFKASPSMPHLTPCSPSLARRPSLAPASSLPPAITAQASTTVASLLQSLPSRVCPSVSFTIGLWSFPSARTRQDLTGDPRSSSLDFGRPPERVDRVIQWVILRFLAHTPSLISGEARWPILLTNCAQVRPDSSPLTSSPACARGSADSDHPRRWPAYRRDPQDRPYTLDHLTGAVSPPVSPYAPFFLHDHCSITEGPQVQFPETLGGFLQSRRLMWIVHRGPVCNSLKNFRQGPQRKTVFHLPISIYPF
jgi:hypothetical protein